MNPLFEKLMAHGSVVTDGAWGTEIQARGLPVGGCPDSWNLTNPESVEEIGRAYVEAGSRVILTNTFGSNRFRLEPYGLAEQAAELNRAGAAISRRAAGTSAKVFGSMGPSGLRVGMAGATRESLRRSFVEQADSLAEGGADALLVETMIDLAEARIALDAAKSTGLPVVVSMVFDIGNRAGHSPEQAVCELEDFGADAIGTNCASSAESILRCCSQLWTATDLPLWVKPNAGIPEMVDGRAAYPTTPAEFTRGALALVEAGANFVGGCCGAGPAHIAELARSLSLARV